MTLLVSSQIMRECEERNFAAGTADPRDLMQIAAAGCVEEFMKFFSTTGNAGRIVVFAGFGNNGGDGVVMAGLLSKRVALPVVLALADRERFSDSGKFFFKQLPPEVVIEDASSIILHKTDVVIDALLGTGCRAPVREPFRSLIDKINAAMVKVFAVDLPSGLGADRCIKADFTAVIGFFKDVVFTPQGIEHCGILRKVALPLPLMPEVPENTPQCTTLEWFEKTAHHLPRNVHKYQRGNILICGGSKSYPQAPFLSALSALRSGAGMVHLAVPFEFTAGTGTLAVIPHRVPENEGSFCKESFKTLEPMLPKLDVIAAGPGMGRSADAAKFIEQLLAVDKPLILDADAIHLAALFPKVLCTRCAPTLLTPHRGEAAVLAGAYNIKLSKSDPDDARKLARASNCTVLLKGARTVIADADGRIFINTSGTPALATAGSGDTLTGLAAAEMCHHAALEAAARSAFLHGLAGEMAALEFGEQGVIADDLAAFIARAGCSVQRFGDIFA